MTISYSTILDRPSGVLVESPFPCLSIPHSFHNISNRVEKNRLRRALNPFISSKRRPAGRATTNFPILYGVHGVTSTSPVSLLLSLEELHVMTKRRFGTCCFNTFRAFFALAAHRVALSRLRGGKQTNLVS